MVPIKEIKLPLGKFGVEEGNCVGVNNYFKGQNQRVGINGQFSEQRKDS